VAFSAPTKARAEMTRGEKHAPIVIGDRCGPKPF
jgi:hypothetical protein